MPAKAEMQTRLVEWNNFESSRFAASGLKLECFDISEDRELHVRTCKSVATRDISQITCLQWSPSEDKKNLLAYGCLNSVVGVIDWYTGKDITLNLPAKIRKPCTAVSWNLSNTSLIGGSFDKQKGDCCAVIWDINGMQEVDKLYVYCT